MSNEQYIENLRAQGVLREDNTINALLVYNGWFSFYAQGGKFEDVNEATWTSSAEQVVTLGLPNPYTLAPYQSVTEFLAAQRAQKDIATIRDVLGPDFFTPKKRTKELTPDQKELAEAKAAWRTALDAANAVGEEIKVLRTRKQELDAVVAEKRAAVEKLKPQKAEAATAKQTAA